MPPSSSPPIVVGVDGSEDSLQAVRWAAGVARAATGTAIHLIEAVSLPPIPDDSWLRTAASLIEEAEGEARERLERAATELRAAGIGATIQVRRWLAAESLIELAGQIGAGMIVVGRRGKSARRALLGSVSGEVSRRSAVPVTVVRGGSTASPPRRILLALDGSPASRAAAAAVRRWFPHAEVVVASVSDPAARDRGEAASDAGELLDGMTAVRRLSLEGDPAGALLAAATSEGVDLVCAGRRGRGTLRDLLVGGVAEKLLQLSPVPLLLAH